MIRAHRLAAVAALLSGGCRFVITGVEVADRSLPADQEPPADLGPAADEAPAPDLTGGNTATGDPCRDAQECASGFCFDGVCCAVWCGATCTRCDLRNREGQCLPAAAGSDPRDECGSETSDSCGRTGDCDGAGACTLWPAGTPCAPSTCMQDSVVERRCSGLGSCVSTAPLSCGAYSCDPAKGSCYTRCTSDAQCAQNSRGCTGARSCH